MPVAFVGDVARKQGEPTQLAREAARTVAAVAVAPPDVLVPRVVRSDVPGVLDTARVPAYRSLYALAVAGDPRLEARVTAAGRALAHFQRRLRPPAWDGPVMPPPFDGPAGARVAVHGDFNGSNVGWDTAGDRLVVLDWSPAPTLGVHGDLGSRWFDPLWFAIFFFRFRPFDLRVAWRPEAWAGAFLTAYDPAPGAVAELAAFARGVEPWLASDFAEERARRGRGLRRLPFRLWQAAGWRRWARFVAALTQVRAP